ncbi:MAG: SDR family NAD(P)-dependent oxidoreductase, partial [Thermomicrobiales bacterium]
MSLVGKRALVTGGSKGIGAGIALALAREGADVAVNSHSDRAGAEGVARQIGALGRKAVALGANVGQVADCQRLVRE